MRCVIQRVRHAEVRVNEAPVGAIDRGYLVLLAVHRLDTAAVAGRLARKIAQLRLFPDGQGKFDRDLATVGGAVLLVSQFTLYGDCRKGRRPSFTDSAPPELARPLCDAVADALRAEGLRVETGIFGAHMDVTLVNDGPVTVIVEEAEGADRSGKPERSERSDGNDRSDLPPPADLRALLAAMPEMILQWCLPPSPAWDALPSEHREIMSEAVPALAGKTDAFRERLFELLVSEKPAEGLRFLLKSGALALFLPELCETVDLSSEDDRRHKHVWDHTLQVVTQIEPRLELRLAALFHDIGKVRTREFTPDGKVTFYGHDRVGGRMFRKIAQRLGIPDPPAGHVQQLVALHLRPGQYQPSWTDSAVRRFERELPEGVLDDLLALGRSDITSKRPGRREQAVRLIDELDRRIREIVATDAIVPPLPTGLGNVLMERLGMTPGPELGRIMKQLIAGVEAGSLERGADFDYYLGKLAELRPDLFK